MWSAILNIYRESTFGAAGNSVGPAIQPFRRPFIVFVPNSRMHSQYQRSHHSITLKVATGFELRNVMFDQQFPLVCQVLKKAEFLICAFVKIGGKMRLGQLVIGIAGRNLLEGSGVCDGQDGRQTKTRHSTSEFVGRWLIHPRS
jgi:hypothetical protein